MYTNEYKFCSSQNVDKFKNNVWRAEHVNTCYLLLRGFLTFYLGGGMEEQRKGQIILSIRLLSLLIMGQCYDSKSAVKRVKIDK